MICDKTTGAPEIPRAYMGNQMIITERINPPIPVNNFDWTAYRDGYDAGDPVGYGTTERAAIEDLLDKESE
jgi:hypothetical protein